MAAILRRAIDARVPVNLVVVVMLVTTVAAPLPHHVGVRWEVQPTLVLRVH